MSRSPIPALKIVANASPKLAAAADGMNQLRLTRALARAMARQDRLEAALRKARAEVDAAFGPWAAGRKIDRDEARQQLASTGFLPRRRVWE